MVCGPCCGLGGHRRRQFELPTMTKILFAALLVATLFVSIGELQYNIPVFVRCVLLAVHDARKPEAQYTALGPDPAVTVCCFVERPNAVRWPGFPKSSSQRRGLPDTQCPDCV